jgi:hypothetical protein
MDADTLVAHDHVSEPQHQCLLYVVTHGRLTPTIPIRGASEPARSVVLQSLCP